VQRNPKFLVGLEYIQERQVAVLIRLLKDTIKVANGLVIVEYQAKISWSSHGVVIYPNGKSRMSVASMKLEAGPTIKQGA
jgi:hypothetical protein